MDTDLASHHIVWLNKGIHGLKIKTCCYFFLVSEETKFEDDTDYIILIYLYPFENLKK